MSESYLVPSYARKGNYRTGKASSSDLSGGNTDFIHLDSGKEHTIFSPIFRLALSRYPYRGCLWFDYAGMLLPSDCASVPRTFT